MGSKIKQLVQTELDEDWPGQTDVFNSVFRSIANYTESQNNATDKTKKIEIRLHHPEGHETALDLSRPWQFAEPSTELGVKEPNATLFIHVRPDRKAFSVLQSVLQSQGYCTRSLTTAEPKAMNAMRDGWGSVVAKEVYWFADNELSKDWPAMDVQAEIKRNIYSSIASYAEAEDQAKGAAAKIEMAFHHPQGFSTALDLTNVRIGA